jgi:hypothetical protein
MSVIGEIVRAITGEATSMLQPLIDKIGMMAIASTVGLTTAQKNDYIPETTMFLSDWVMTDYALAISMITGILFGAEKIVNIYFKIKAERKESKDTPDKVDTPN